MEIPKLLLEGYLTFGILLTYTITFIIGVLVGERQAEKEQEEYVKQVQSEKEKPFNGTKFTFME